ncbi:MAG: GNAT family N-acetyltransferase [Verrucomicrobiota bacterium]
MPEIFDVRVRTWSTPTGREDLESMGITRASVSEMLTDTHKGWLCETDGQVVGFAIGNRSTGEMWVIAVLEEYEGRGIGGKLIGMVEQWLASEGHQEIWLTTYTDETKRAVGFYHHLGWEFWKIENKDRFLKKRLQATGG